MGPRRGPGDPLRPLRPLCAPQRSAQGARTPAPAKPGAPRTWPPFYVSVKWGSLALRRPKSRALLSSVDSVQFPPTHTSLLKTVSQNPGGPATVRGCSSPAGGSGEQVPASASAVPLLPWILLNKDVNRAKSQVVPLYNRLLSPPKSREKTLCTKWPRNRSPQLGSRAVRDFSHPQRHSSPQ